MKVSELSGALLDYWVARAMNFVVPAGDYEQMEWPIVVLDGMPFLPFRTSGYMYGPDMSPDAGGSAFQPSTNWAQGGPIVERDGISLLFRTQQEDDPVETAWRATYTLSTGAISGEGRISSYLMSGPTPLNAAMRAYVASNFGENVPDEVTA